MGSINFPKKKLWQGFCVKKYCFFLLTAPWMFNFKNQRNAWNSQDMICYAFLHRNFDLQVLLLYVCFQWQRLSVFSGVSRHIFNPSKIPQISPTNNSHRPQPTPSPPSARAKNRAHASAKTRGRSPRLSSPSNGNGNDSKKSPSSQRCEMGSGGFLPHSQRDLQFELSLN